MTLKEFANTNRLKVTLDDCGDPVIAGKCGEIYEQATDTLAVLFMPPSKTDHCGRWCPKVWNNFRRTGEALGMRSILNGDSEGAMIFDPESNEQVRLAIKIAKARVKRVVSEDRRAVLAATLAAARASRAERLVA
jgi:hypothetical protein